MTDKKKLVVKFPRLNLKKLNLKKLNLKKLNFIKLKFSKEQRRRFWKRVFITALVLFIGLLGVMVGVYRAIKQNLPDISQLEKYEPSIVTYIYADDEEVIGEYFEQRRIPVSSEDIPDLLKQAVIATEDPRFYKHGGIDLIGILRAIKEDIKLIFTPRKLQGGSTISQQLVTNLLIGHRQQTVRRKLKEALLVLELEKRYSKDEILAMYCNQFNLGHGAYGVEAAAQLYYDKNVTELNLEEIAMIAGIFRGPSYYSPYRNYDVTRRRRNHVLNRMQDEGFITPAQADAIKDKELTVLPLHRQDSDFAGHFREEVRLYLYENYGREATIKQGLKVYTTLNLAYQRYAEVALRRQLRVLDKRQGWRDDKPNLVDKGVENLEELEKPVKPENETETLLSSWRRPFLEPEAIIEAVVLSVERREALVKVKDFYGKMSNKGIEWTRSRDLTRLIQRGDIIHVEIKKIDEEKKELEVSLDQEPLLEGAFLAIEPQTGQIKAMVGGYSFQRSEWNNATQAMRQAGSVIKPMLYTAGLENGLTTTSPFIDEPTEFPDKWSGEIWSPPNYDHRYKGRVTLRQGLEESRNIVTAKLLDDISPQTGVEYCRKFGITSTIYPYLSLSLGTFEVNMVELVSAFTTFPNAGVRVQPYFITRIEDKEGNILEECKIESEEVISPQIAYIMTTLLKGVVQRGTAQAARFLEKPLGGKTGTSDDHADARFVGFSPSLCAGVWVGHREGRFPIGDRQSGAVAALPVWQEFFEKIIEDEKRISEENGEEWEPEADFPIPPNLSFVDVDRKTGLRPSPICLPQYIIREVFLPGTEPNRFCSLEDHMMTWDYYDTLRKRE